MGYFDDGFRPSRQYNSGPFLELKDDLLVENKIIELVAKYATWSNSISYIHSLAQRTYEILNVFSKKHHVLINNIH
jgi:hypothetical protein